MDISTNSNMLSLVAISAVLLAFLVFSIWISIVSRRIKGVHELLENIFKGKKNPNLEELLANHEKSLKLLDRDIQELYNISNQINGLALSGIHKFSSIRFNPFKDVGGDQSFSIALLNGKNDGIVITSLYTREGTRVYSKSILSGESEKYPLTNEEKEVIKLAMAQGKKIIQ